MHVRRMFRSLLIFAALMAVAATLRADGPGADRYVLLTNGRIMAGQVVQDAQGYLVVGRHGRIHTPYEYVRLVADSLHDVYRQQRDALPSPISAQDRLDLARWCISYSLYDEARLELKQVLRSDPNQSEARQMLKQLAEILRPDKPEERPRPTRTLDGYLVPQAESLGSLSKETAAIFAAKVQPILVSKCGNARCHGIASDHEFRLVHVRSGVNSHRIHTERNLAALSPYLDLKHPADSPLLAVAQGNHGGGASLFGGAGGDRQLEIVREWVFAVARERGGYREEPLAEDVATVQPAIAEEVAPEVSPDRFLPGDPARDAAVVDVRQSPAPTNPAPTAGRDPFDPEIFNALVHGGVLPPSR